MTFHQCDIGGSIFFFLMVHHYFYLAHYKLAMVKNGYVKNCCKFVKNYFFSAS